MDRRFNVIFAALLAVFCLGTIGCQDQKLADAEKKYQDLSLKHDQLQKDYADCQTRNADLESQLQTKDAELASARAARPAVVLPSTGGKNAAAPEGWEPTATGAKIVIGTDILFETGKASLTPAGQKKLREVAATIKKTYPTGMVQVYGFTDQDPVVKTRKLWQDNLDLSANRAMTVTRELIHQGLVAGRIETIAMGATHPVSQGKDKAAKAKNRRVEIAVAH